MNPDHAFALDFLGGERAPMPIVSNPLARALSAQLLELDPEGKSVLSFEPGPQFLQGAGVLQGGTLATMLDFGLVFALFAALEPDRSCGTASLTVNMMKPAPRGRYLVRAHLDRLGGQVAFGSAVLQSTDDRTIATASAVMPLTRR